MTDERELQSLNRRYLMVTRTMAQQNLDRAAQITGLSKDLLKVIAELTLDEIERMRVMKYLLLQPRIPDAAFLKMLELSDEMRSSFMAATCNLPVHPL
ncbi:MAG: hypothetical protein D4R84_02550 [Rhodocyclaceae bacterium]|nr:MAG: hypothetical protein D4R84_02550 [Rhodocyclaceae bacterium]